MKISKWKSIVSSLFILLPVVAEWILLEIFSEQVVYAGGLTKNTILVMGIIQTVVLWILHFVCLYFTMKDCGNQNQSEKALGMTFWIVPIIAWFPAGISMKALLHLPFDLTFLTLVFLSALLIIVGNYLPKCRRNSTLGIKVKWTLYNDENWNATHRFGGRVWVIGGLVLFLLALLPKTNLILPFFPVMLVVIFAPMIYSYLYYRKQKEAGTYTEDTEVAFQSSGKYVRIFVIVILFFVAVLLSSGSIRMQYNESDFEINATYWNDLTIRYEDVKEITYLEQYQKGSREMGFGSAKLGMGYFHNDEFGDYTLYAYNHTSQGVCLKVGEETIVISAKDEEATKAIYEELCNRIQ
ncbi:MAG: SdpI family protein [Lachnospiraceae bacterium]|nr:SdpI family protein [Lachnospiraceae bacterium]